MDGSMYKKGAGGHGGSRPCREERQWWKPWQKQGSQICQVNKATHMALLRVIVLAIVVYWFMSLLLIFCGWVFDSSLVLFFVWHPLTLGHPIITCHTATQHKSHIIIHLSNLAENFTTKYGQYGLWTPKRVWVIGYWRVWVMLIKSLRTNLGVMKRYRLLESMGYQRVDCFFFLIPFSCTWRYRTPCSTLHFNAIHLLLLLFCVSPP